MLGSAYYWPFTHGGWLVDAPPSLGHSPNTQMNRLTGRPPPPDWREIVIQRELNAGVTIAAERWGLVRFDFSRWPPGRTDDQDQETDLGSFDKKVRLLTMRLKVMNTQLLALHSALITSENLGFETVRLHPLDLIHFQGNSMSGPGVLRIPHLLGPQDILLRLPHFVISMQAFELSLEILDTVLCSNGLTLTYCDLLNQAYVAYQEHDYATSVVGSWTVAELLVSERWRQYLEAKSDTLKLSDGTEVERIYTERHKRLRDLSSSHIIDALELATQLSHDQFRRLTSVRKGRNRWLHDGTVPGHDIAMEGMAVATDLLCEDTGVLLRLSGGRTISGI